MENTHTLASMFESNKQALEEDLIELVLPKDAEVIQKKVCKFLNSMFDNDGEFKQHLTQAENYIINDVVDLLNVQQDIIKEFVNKNHPTHTTVNVDVKEDKTKKNLYALLGAGAGGSLGVVTGNYIGGSVGTFIGTWGTVFGAIAGTAIVIYCSASSSKNKKSIVIEKEIFQIPIDANAFLDIVKKICDRVDKLIGTFRNQIERVENAYKNEEKRSLIKDYPSLSERLEELFQLANFEEKYKNEELLSQIDLIKRALKNYGVIYEDGKLKNK